MQSLLGGADKASSSNPLKQVVQREGVDNSLFKDRFAPPSGGSAQLPFRPNLSGPVHHQLSTQLRTTPQPFNLSHLSDALASGSTAQDRVQAQIPRQFESQWDAARSISASSRHTPVARYSPAKFQQISPGQSEWATSFHDGKGKSRAFDNDIPQAQTVPPQYGGRPYMPSSNYQPTFQPIYSGGGYHPQASIQILNSQGRTEEAQKEMELAFERALEDARAQTGRGSGDVRVEGDEMEGVEDRGQAKGDLEAVWESLRPEAERLGQLAEWERDFSQFVSGEDDLMDTLNESLARDDVGQTSLDEQLRLDSNDTSQFDNFTQAEDGLPQISTYEYSTENPYTANQAQESYHLSQQNLSTGSLLSATLHLETFLQKATVEDYEEVATTPVEAWSLLGRIHAMNEKEERALEAFERGREVLEGESGGMVGVRGGGEMLTNLAISYVNESQDLAALTTLHRFLTLLHPTHAGKAPSQTEMIQSDSPWGLSSSMTDRFLGLAKEQYTTLGQVDADVQVGLGTLYYMMGEYESARDCWIAALAERPDDYLLWNRLGATLANGGNPEEAVDAYRRALELKPTFTRAIYNLGVACLNIGVHREAAEHFLAALSLHARNTEQGGRPGVGREVRDESSGIWMTLRRSLEALGMNDLAGQARTGTDLGVFKRAGFDF